MPGRGVWYPWLCIYSHQQLVNLHDDSFLTVSSVLRSRRLACHRLWLFLSWSNVTLCRCAISVQKKRKKEKSERHRNMLFSKTSPREPICEALHKGPHLSIITFKSRGISLSIVEYASTALAGKRGQSGNFHI